MMTGWNDAGFEPISRITVASLADLGYRVNWAATETFTPPSSTPTGGGWWGNITQWNPGSAADPSDARPSPSVERSEGTASPESLVSWNVVSSTTNPTGQRGSYKGQDAAWWSGPSLNELRKIALHGGLVQNEDRTAPVATASISAPWHGVAKDSSPYTSRKIGLRVASNQAWTEAVDCHLRRWATANDATPLVTLVGDLDLSWVAGVCT